MPSMIQPCPTCGRKGIMLKRTGNCIHCSAGKKPPSSAAVRNKPSKAAESKATKPDAAKTRRPRGVKITNVTIVARNADYPRGYHFKLEDYRGGRDQFFDTKAAALAWRDQQRDAKKWELYEFMYGAGDYYRKVKLPAKKKRRGSSKSARNYAPAKKRWSKKAIKHPGKLGGPGFLRKPLAAQKRIMDKCVQDWGYKSCLGSLAFMANMPSGRPFRSRIALLREHLVATHGGSRRNPTGTLRGKGKRQWEHVYESQRARGLPKSRAAASAWSTVKKGYRKKGGKWQARKRNESQDRLREREIREHLGYAEHELKELREDGSKADAHVAQRAIDHARKLAERIDADRDRRQLMRMVAQYQERLDRVTGKSRNRAASKRRRSAGVRNKAFWGD